MGNDGQVTQSSLRGFVKTGVPRNYLCPALVLLLFVFPALGQAEDFAYTTNNGEITIVRYTFWPGGAVIIPPQINGLPVTSIGDFAFASCTNVTSITMPNSVTMVGQSAFAYCHYLANVKLSDALSSIQDAAFAFCGDLTNVVIPTGVTHIGSGAFLSCISLTNVTIPSGVSNLSDQLFQNCSSLTRVTIPSGVTRIGSHTFDFCRSLINVMIPRITTEIGAYAFSGCLGMKAIFFEGDAPVFGSAVFYGGTDGTVYFLPGTSGWETTFGGLPTALWRPQIQASDASFGVRANQFGFNIAWAEGMTVVVDACTDLANPIWSPLQTNTLIGGTSYFSDPEWTNFPARFYRVRWP